MAKHDLFPIPFLGWHMSLAGYIPLKRDNVESGKNAVFKARDWLKKGVSVLFFPEGTRSPDGEIKELKAGAFRLAQQEKLKVLPIVINGTFDAIPKESWRIKKRTEFTLVIEKPRDLSQIKNLAVVEEIRTEMIGRLKEVRQSMANENFQS